MNKEWVDKKNKEFMETLEEKKRNVEKLMETIKDLIDDQDYSMLRKEFDDNKWFELKLSISMSLMHLLSKKAIDVDNFKLLMDKLQVIKDDIEYLHRNNLSERWYDGLPYDRYLDSEPIMFDGDIIITDPCYIMKEKNNDKTFEEKYENCPNWWDFLTKVKSEERVDKNGKTYTYYIEPKAKDYPDCRVKLKSDYDKDTEFLYEFEKDKNPPAMFSPTLKSEWEEYYAAREQWRLEQEDEDDWERCDYGSNMEVLGITHYMTRDTIYGDWSCTTYDTNTKEPIGEFCADAGLVSVIALDEVLKYNPDFDYHEKRKWTTTWIKDFKGTVQFIVKEVVWYYDDDYVRNDGSYAWRKGDKAVDYEVEVIGNGVNKLTGEKINFIGTQTGL